MDYGSGSELGRPEHGGPGHGRPGHRVEPFDGTTAPDADLRAHHALVAAANAERFPGFPATPYAAFAAAARGGRHALGPHRAWAARAQDGTLIGVATAVYPEPEHASSALARVTVHAAHRRRGTGTALLRALVADAGAAGRLRLVDEQVLIGSPGERWARAVGFTEVLRNCWQVLHVQQADRRRWTVQAPAGFRVEHWVGAAPEPLVDAFAAARNAMADAPTGASGFVPEPWTARRVRRAEASAAAAGEQLWYAVAVHEASGEVAALTGVIVDPLRTELCWQRDTAVVRAYRGLGLAPAVKAAMMNALLAEHPALGRIVTSTAADNAAMRRVNERIGYVRYAGIGMYEAEVADLAARLGTRPALGAVPAQRPAAVAHAEPLGAP